MFVHLGGNTVVDARDVVAILDARRLHRVPDARALIDRAARRSGDAAAWVSARTVVVTTTGAYPAPISPATVARRIAQLANLPRPPKAER